jgi:hypothetical protein
MANHSDVARLLQEIDERNRAASRGLSDVAAVASHKSIIDRMQQGAEPILQLFKQGRGEDAMHLWEEWVDSQL